jgi:hypothetical protein
MDSYVESVNADNIPPALFLDIADIPEVKLGSLKGYDFCRSRYKVIHVSIQVSLVTHSVGALAALDARVYGRGKYR